MSIRKLEKVVYIQPLDGSIYNNSDKLLFQGGNRSFCILKSKKTSNYNLGINISNNAEVEEFIKEFPVIGNKFFVKTYDSNNNIRYNINEKEVSEYIMAINNRQRILNPENEEDRFIYHMLSLYSEPEYGLVSFTSTSSDKRAVVYIRDDQKQFDQQANILQKNVEYYTAYNQLKDQDKKELAIIFGIGYSDIKTIDGALEIIYQSNSSNINKAILINCVKNQKYRRVHYLVKKAMDNKIIKYLYSENTYVYDNQRLGATKENVVSKILEDTSNELLNKIKAAVDAIK